LSQVWVWGPDQARYIYCGLETSRIGAPCTRALLKLTKSMWLVRSTISLSLLGLYIYCAGLLGLATVSNNLCNISCNSKVADYFTVVRGKSIATHSTATMKQMYGGFLYKL